MATDTDSNIESGTEAPGFVLDGIPWAIYEALRAVEGTRAIRMTYLDGRLTLMAPQYLHDSASFDFGQLVIELACALGIDIEATLTTTLRRRTGRGRRAVAKEPDQGFYIGANASRIRGKETIDLSIDPPPDLAIEIIDKADSPVMLRAYARLGVPEVWRYRPRRRDLWFGRLEGDEYRPVDRSVALPMVTRASVGAIVLERVSGGLRMIDWKTRLVEWARGLPPADQVE